MKKILVILIAIVMVAACKKEEETPPPTPKACETENSGWIEIVNNLGEEFVIEINGDSISTIPDNVTGTLYTQTGNYDITLTEVDNLVNPAVYDTSIALAQCATFTWEP